MRRPTFGAGRIAALVAALLAAAWPALGAPSTSRPIAVLPVADFEGRMPEGTRAGNAEVKLTMEPGAAAVGAGCLQVRIVNTGEDAYVVLPLPSQGVVDPQSKLVAWIRRPDTGKPIRLNWFALDADNWVIFQRRFQFDRGTEWVKMEWPLSSFRWGNERTGEWADVRSIALRVESEASELYLDDVGLADSPSEDAFREQFLRTNAFPSRKSRIAVEDGFLVGTDAVDELSSPDVKSLLAQMKRVRDWTRRIFGDAVRPTNDGPPTSLLIFRQKEEYQSFFKRLGLFWNVDIIPPRGSGYTVQDICACVYEAGRPPGKAVALHETVHAVISRQLRLLPAAPAHAWLQEGLANYLQLCLYPGSLRRGEYSEDFARPIGPKTFFRPLEELVGKPVQSRHYAQLASLVAWMIEERPDWLRQIAKGLADGKEIADILKSLDTDLTQMEKLWFEWGKRSFVSRTPSADGEDRLFPLPPEWASETKS